MNGYFDKGNVQDSGFGGPLGIIPDHMTAMQTKNLMGEEHWSSLFSFTIVRNPWARAYSLFQYRLKIKKDIPSDLPFETYLTALQVEKKKPSWLQSWYHGYLLSSCQFISSKVGDVIISKVYKFEDRKGMVADLNTHLSHPISGNLHLMKTGEGQPYQSFYTTKSKTIVSDLYRDDIELFNYSFDTPSF